MWVNTEICMTNILFKIQGNLKNTNHDRWHLYICTQNTQLHESNNIDMIWLLHGIANFACDTSQKLHLCTCYVHACI